MAVTISQVAQQCGKSITTVSHVLRRGQRADQYPEATRRLVWQAAEELEYRPNLFASQMHQRNRKVIMLCFGGLEDPYAATIAGAFGLAAAEKGYGVFAGPLAYGEESRFYEGMLGGHGILALAVIGYTSAGKLPDERLVELAEDGVRVVSIGRPVASGQVSQVLYDNEAGVRSALDYLLEQGAQRFWLLGGNENPGEASGIAGQRIQMAEQYLRQKAVQDSPVLVPPRSGSSGPDRGQLAIADALAQRPAPDAIFCGADPLAWGCIRGLADAGVQAGRDVAVVGFNDNAPSEHMTPSLTTVRIPMMTLGQLGANLLIDVYE